MPRELRLVLLCAMLPTAFGACGRITHDIGQIAAENQKRDAGVTSPPDDTLDADRRNEGTGNAGNAQLLGDATSDGAVVEDAEQANLAKDGDIRSVDASDALVDECVAKSIEVPVVPSELDIYLMVDAFLLIGNLNWSDLIITPFPLSDTPWSDFLPATWSDVFTSAQFQLWTEVRPEISDFIDDTSSQGIGVGINYYGQPESIFNPISCEPDTYEQPKVEIAQLPDNAEAIKASLRRTPNSTSPAAPALEGAINHAKSRVQAYPTRKQVVFLMTGATGLMTDPVCRSTSEKLERIAAQGFAESIATYFIGIYIPGNIILDEEKALKGYLSEAAVQGGTSGLYLASLDSEKSEVALKLEEARYDAERSACRLDLKEGLPGDIDPAFASMVATTNDNKPIDLQLVGDHSFCSQTERGWYFDNPLNPSSLVPCERTCAVLLSESISHVELRLLSCPN